MAAGETSSPEASPPPIGGGAAVGGKSMAKLATLTASMVAVGVALVMYTSGTSEESETRSVPPVTTQVESVSDAASTDSFGSNRRVEPNRRVSPSRDSGAPRLEPTASSPASARPAARNTDADRLAEEVALLTRAQKAFHAGNFKGALAAVDAHRRKFPKGVLAQERVNLKMRTLCGMGREREAQVESNRLNRLAPGHVSSDDVCRRGK